MMRVLEYSSLLRTTTPSMMAPKIPVDPNFWPSLYQPKVMGRLPSKIWHETADLIPSLSNLLGKRKGMMVGGAETSPIKHQLKLTCLRWEKKSLFPTWEEKYQWEIYGAKLLRRCFFWLPQTSWKKSRHPKDSFKVEHFTHKFSLRYFKLHPCISMAAKLGQLGKKWQLCIFQIDKWGAFCKLLAWKSYTNPITMLLKAIWEKLSRGNPG